MSVWDSLMTLALTGLKLYAFTFLRHKPWSQIFVLYSQLLWLNKQIFLTNMFPLTSYYDENNCLSVSVVLCLSVPCQHRGEAAPLQHPHQAAWGSETGPIWWWDGIRRIIAYTPTDTQTHFISRSLFPLFQKRRRAGMMRVTLSPGRYWSTSLSSSSTPRLRGRPGPRRKRASSDPRSVRLARGHKSHRNIIARMGSLCLVWGHRSYLCPGLSENTFA